LAHGCYEVQWVEKSRAQAFRADAGPGCWLIFADDRGRGDALAARLASAGERAVCVRQGTGFAVLGAERLTADPARGDDYLRVLEAAGATGPLRGIVHLWSLNSPRTEKLDLASLRAAQVGSTASLLHLVHALGRAEGISKPRVWIVTEQAQAIGQESELQIAQAALFGLGKAFMLENPELWGGMVDLEPGPIEGQARAILGELSGPDDECHTAWRAGRRLVPRLVRRPPPKRESVRVSEDATYLIVGGTGGLGLRVARWLVEAGARSLVLTSRKGAGEAALSEIRLLEQRGAHVLSLSADVTSEKDMAAVFEKICSPLPPLRGVVNTSGVVQGALLAQESSERFLEVLDVKLAGSFNLHLLTRDRPLDFFVSFSSASALLASPGQASYAAGNAFQDALGHHRVRSGLPGLSVNWGNWGEVGMVAALPEAGRRLFRERGLGEIDAREALSLLGDLIVEGRAQVGVMPVNWAKFVRVVSGGSVTPYLERVVPRDGGDRALEGEPAIRDKIAHAPVSAQRELLAGFLQGRVATVLGYAKGNQVDRELTLLELGFDSLMAVQLRNAIRSSLEVDVPISRLVDSTSIEGLVELLREQLAVSAGGVHVLDVI
jgi:NAD(P)-dependent dehydrogenase (short-subunit alcohol dehydrogenase family)/acyl carrier protein